MLKYKMDTLQKNYVKVMWMLLLLLLTIQQCLCLECGQNEHNLNGLRCCKQCGPGEGVVTSCNQDNDTVCKACSKGEMYSTIASHEESCQLCKICPQYSHVKRNCNETHDTVCECDLNYYWDSMSRACHQCDVCPMGFGAKRHCDAHRNSVCAQCSQGAYSDVISDEPCKKCSQCNENQLMIRYCDSMHDTMCVDMPSPEADLSDMMTTVTTPVVSQVENTQDKLIPVYCTVLGLVILLAIIYVIVKQVQYRQNPPNNKKNVTYSAVTKPQGPGDNLTQQTTTQISRGSDSGVSLDPDSRNVSGSTRIKDLAPVKLMTVEKMLHSCLEYRGGWTSLARELGYNNAKIASFESKASQSGRMPCEMLLAEWSKSENATVEVLVNMLRSLGRDDIIHALYSENRNINSAYSQQHQTAAGHSQHLDCRNNIPMYNNVDSMHNISQAPSGMNSQVQGHFGHNQLYGGQGHLTSSLSGSSTTDASSRYGRPLGPPSYHTIHGQQMV